MYETDTRMREWSTVSNGAKCLGKIKIYSFQLDFLKIGQVLIIEAGGELGPQ